MIAVAAGRLPTALLPPALASFLLAGTIAVFLAGCATPPPADDPDAVADFQAANDPLEPTNRKFYAFNDALDTYVLRPVARGYRAVVPQPIRTGIHNVLANVSSPVLFMNDVAEAKPKRAGDTMVRFILNSTIGLAGIFDVADKLGYHQHDSGFGTTLALWGVPGGVFLYLPVLGPTNPRDAAGFGTDVLTDPLTWASAGVGLTIAGDFRYGANTLDQRERLLDTVDNIKQTALDPYATFRSLYRQHREAEIEKVKADNAATVPVWFDQPAAPSR